MSELEQHLLLEGTYVSFDKNVDYAQENFKLIHFPDLQQYHLQAEISSRTETGEFLKILVRYEMNHHYIPISIRIEKTMGNRFAHETFKIDTTEQELIYTFQNATETKELKRALSAKHYLTTPAFSTSSFFTLSKKFDQTGRTSLIFVSSPNEWDFTGPLEEKIVYGEYKSRDSKEFKIKDKVLVANHLCLFEHNTSDPKVDVPVDLFISHYHGLPYELLQGDQKIIVKALKKNF